MCTCNVFACICSQRQKEKYVHIDDMYTETVL